MPSSRLGAVIVCAVVLTTKVVSANDDTIPKRFVSKFGGDPIWISATEAISPEGTLRKEIRRTAHLQRLIARHEKERSRRAVAPDAQSTAECDIAFSERFTDGPDDGAVTSLEILDEMGATRSIITGRVSASRIGIHDSTPYTILQVDVDSPGTSPKRVYLMYPRGRLQFDGLSVCNVNPLYSELPSVGDQLVFIASYPIDSTGTLFSTPLIIYEHEASVVIPPHLQLEQEAQPSSVRLFAARLREVQQQKQR
ncbi:MAG TPA: hypothetical protein VEK79_01890 [Thermoanaerobaculia bacterium]|nr:hypothetical protein [Thermoanaerobaculia bacterium]